MLRLVGNDEHPDAPPESYPFPCEEARRIEPLSNGELAERLLGARIHSADDILASLDTMSHRINELACEFKGRTDFDDPDGDDDGPSRAA